MSDHYDRYNGIDKLISKQAAIEALEIVGYDFSESELSEVELEEVCGAVSDVRQDMIDRIKQLSPAEPKSGKWKNIVDGIEYTWGTCDTCGARIPMPYKYYEYCPHCGMKNEVTT